MRALSIRQPWAWLIEGFRPEDKGFLDIARARIEHAQAQRAADMPLFQEAAQ